MDKCFEESSIRKNVENLIATLLDVYKNEVFDKNDEKLDWMYHSLSKVTKQQEIANDDSSEDNSALIQFEFENFFHRIVHFINFLQGKESNRLRRLVNRLALNSLKDLLTFQSDLNNNLTHLSVNRI